MIRFLDIVFSLVFLLILLPFILIISIVSFLTSGSPLLFVQPRVGINGKLFPFMKFRTMIVIGGANSGDSPDYLTMSLDDVKELRKQYKTTKKNDSRITPFGKFLRKTSLDELPQLLNILFGHMSFVGPRPDPPIQRADYSEEEWFLRCKVKPGLTGLAQINGRSEAEMNSRTANDLKWVKSKSVFLYFKILIKTPIVLFKNVY